jgi:hypothetical protein
LLPQASARRQRSELVSSRYEDDAFQISKPNGCEKRDSDGIP